EGTEAWHADPRRGRHRGAHRRAVPCLSAWSTGDRMPEPAVDPRCAWALGDPLMEAYHDHEWGIPLHDDRALFELLTLEGAQAGLSWSTILRRRDGYRSAFAGFEPARVAAFSDADVQALLANPAIIRNRQKIVSTIENA